MKFAPTLAAVLALWIASCGDDNASSERTGSEDQAARFGDFETHLDLLALAHLADVDYGGTFVDFGTPAQGKYTGGDWRSGWGTRGHEGDTTFAYVGKRGKIWFQAEQAGPVTVRLQLRPFGTGAMTPYINGEQVQSVFFEQEGGFRNVDFKLPPERVRKGENELLLTFGGAVEIKGEEVSVAVATARIVAGSKVSAAQYDAPTWDTLKAKVSLDDEERDALAVRRTTRLSWYLQVPPQARLVFGVGMEGPEGKNAATRVRVTPEQGKGVTVFEESVESDEWEDEVIDLTRFSGKAVRLDLEAPSQGAGRIAWSQPMVVVPETESPEFEPAHNLVVVLIDTLRASKVRPWNSKTRVRTPILDQVAKEGTVFTSAQSTENWTKPSVAGILTGLYPRTHGARTQEAVLSESALLLSEHLKAKGLSTASFIGNGYVSDKFGFKQGWDTYRNFIRDGGSTDASNVFEHATKWATEHKDERFFLYIHTIDPHVPYDPGDEYLSIYDKNSYEGPVKPRMTPKLLADAKRNPPRVTFSPRDQQRLQALHDGEITQHDVHMGRFVEKMKELGIWDKTLFVFTSDHGEEFNEHGSWGHGHSVYQELLHVPLMMRLPGTVPGETKIRTTVSTMDIAPTVLQLMQLDPLPKAEGQSRVRAMYGQTPSGPAIAFSEFQDERRVAVMGRWKFFVRGNLTASMFDLERDPGEENQLEVQDHPIAARMLRIYQGHYLGATNPARWLDAEQGRGATLQTDTVQMDDALQHQLEALGYVN